MAYELKRKIDTRDKDGRITRYIQMYGDVSPKVNGALQMRSNKFYLDDNRETSYVRVGPNQISLPGLNSIGPPGLVEANLENQVYATFVKKMRYDNASLGVTLASWKQSRDMIQTRLIQVTTLLKKIKTPKQARRMVRTMRETQGGTLVNKSANNHLEYIFGWVPLFSDITAATAVMASSPPGEFITARGRRSIETTSTSYSPTPWKDVKSGSFTRSCAFSAYVVVNNPNVYLSNQLGVLNPLPTAWDVIPWSFVVGMFVNVNAVLKSFSDFAGVTVTNASITRSVKGFNDYKRSYNPSYYPTLTDYSSTRQFLKKKERVLVTSFPRPTLAVRVPELSVGTITMFASLAVQQSTRILKLLS